MRGILRTALGCVALSFCTLQAGTAADLPVKAVMKPVVSEYNWTGIYSASSFGIGDRQVDGTYVLPPPDRHNSGATQGFYGSYLGFQYQWNKLVLGIEGTLLLPLQEWTQSHSPTGECLLGVPNRSCEHSMSRIWGVGGRLGYAPLDRFMVYGTGGYASARIETRDRVTSTGVINIAEADAYRHGGWYAGAGVDYFVGKVLWSDSIIGIEYRHYDFDTVRHFPTAAGTPSGAPTITADTRDVSAKIDVVSMRATFKFQPGGLPMR